MRVPSFSASWKSWVMNRMVLCRSFCSASSSSCISLRISGSSALNASSMIIRSASVASARASPTRWRMPPLRLLGR